MKKVFFIFLILSLGLHCLYAQTYKPTWESIDSRPVPAWFSDAKFGIFIHWGLYSVPAWAPTKGPVYEKYSEWYWARQNPKDKPFPAFTEFHNSTYGAKTSYTDFVSEFKAEMFDPVKWADIFKQSGAKYIVLTSKHHDGFALWPSEQAWNWNSVEVGPHRDLAGELSEAVKASGLHMGFYYSLYEWYNPLYKKDFPKYVSDHMMPQMKDLVNRYHPEIFWTDGEWEIPSDQWRSTDFLAWLYNESPVKETVVVNDRWGKETRGKHGGFYTTEYDLVGDLAADRVKFGHPWEECRGIGGSFGYNRNENLEDYETSESLIYTLVNKVSMGGNLLLNVGPTADGRIPVIMQQRLKDIGDWLTINGEAIYETHAWKNTVKDKKSGTVFYTVKGDDLYVIATKWQKEPIKVQGVTKANKVSMLGFNGKINYSVSKNTVTINFPQVSPLDNISKYAWVFKITGGAK